MAAPSTSSSAMPDLSLDPSALNVGQSGLSSLASKAVFGGPQGAQKASKPIAVIQRLDLESLYTNLKSAIGEYWAEYKEAVNLFVLGGWCIDVQRPLNADGL